MSCSSRQVIHYNLPTRLTQSQIPVFLLPFQHQRRTFLSRFLRTKNEKPLSENEASRKTSVEPSKARNDGQPRRGSLGPSSILVQQYAANKARKQETVRAMKDRQNSINGQHIWSKLDPNARRLVLGYARSKGWSGPDSSALSNTVPSDLPYEDLTAGKKQIKREEAKIRQFAPALIRRHGRLRRGEIIKRTERSTAQKSPSIKTSVKKLMMLARQVAGKKLDDAMVQMRFSKKKAAKDVLRHLRYAKNKAIAEQQMGLQLPSKAVWLAERAEKEIQQPGTGIMSKTEDQVQVEHKQTEMPDTKTLPLESRHSPDAELDQVQQNTVVVHDRKGKKRYVNDRSAIYIDQAWVGRTKWEYGLDIRARGKSHRLYKPFTSITVLLKEERTRLREAQERAAKKARKPVWVPLPDRPVTAQRQYPLW